MDSNPDIILDHSDWLDPIKRLDRLAKSCSARLFKINKALSETNQIARFLTLLRIDLCAVKEGISN